MTTPLTIDLPDNLNSAARESDRASWHHRLVLDPARRLVTVWSGYGTGTPEALWHDRVISLGTVPDGAADLSPVREALEAHADALDEIAGLHRTAWNGSTDRGGWTDADRARDLLDGVRLAIEAAECPRYWTPEDYYSHASTVDVFGEGGFGGTREELDALTDREIAQARPDYYLDREATRDYLAGWWAAEVERRALDAAIEAEG